MKSLGGTLLILGIGSFILPLMGFQFRLISIFGNNQTIAAIIMVIVGIILLLVGGNKSQA